MRFGKTGCSVVHPACWDVLATVLILYLSSLNLIVHEVHINATLTVPFPPPWCFCPKPAMLCFPNEPRESRQVMPPPSCASPGSLPVAWHKGALCPYLWAIDISRGAQGRDSEATEGEHLLSFEDGSVF